MTTPEAAARLGFPVDPVPQSESSVDEMVRSYAWRLAFYQFCDAHPHYCPLDSDMTDSEGQWLEGPERSCCASAAEP
ncbi:hypothetical protein [Streptomyces purpurogeneiscleroticus]|uniref:hypothetical protein n=1 Tax=Streptomyces purpurogeneiscleroticus TaxID=68259 RepID=UPI001CBB2B7F|nr:hypothetical protein [Streptomyces purpurogeneiscleroticus]MBZ4019669.1 hypothetical protein [Streptomyces purpurogeneiscleroticus]